MQSYTQNASFSSGKTCALSYICLQQIKRRSSAFPFLRVRRPQYCHRPHSTSPIEHKSTSFPICITFFTYSPLFFFDNNFIPKKSCSDRQTRFIQRHLTSEIRLQRWQQGIILDVGEKVHEKCPVVKLLYYYERSNRHKSRSGRSEELFILKKLLRTPRKIFLRWKT